MYFVLKRCAVGISFLAMSKRSFSAKGYGWKKSTKHDDPGNLDPTSTVQWGFWKWYIPHAVVCNPVQYPLIWHLSYSKLYLALPNNNLAHMILLAKQRRWPGRTTPNGEVMESPSTIPSWEALQTRLRQCLNWLRLFREWCAVLGGAVSANGYLTSTYTKANFLGIYFLFSRPAFAHSEGCLSQKNDKFSLLVGQPWDGGRLGWALRSCMILIFSSLAWFWYWYLNSSLANLRLWMNIS